MSGVPSWTSLHRAAFEGDARRASSLLQDARLDPNALTEERATPLFLAAEKGLLEVVQVLLADVRVDPNLCQRNIWHPLYVAVQNGHLEVVRALVCTPRVDVNRTTQEGCTVLYRAANYGQADMVAELLKRPDIKVNLATVDGCTPLLTSVSMGFGDVVELLLQHPDVDINRRSHVGVSPLFHASASGQLGVVRQLLKFRHLDVNTAAKDGHTPLNASVHHSQGDVMQALLDDERVDVNTQNLDRCSPLTCAIMHGAVDAVIQLLAVPRTDPNITCAKLCTPIYSAVQKSQFSILRILLDNPRADPNIATVDGCTPLYTAAFRGCVVSVKQLLSHPRIQVDLPTHDGSTPLQTAAEHHHEEVVRLLLSAGADIKFQPHTQIGHTRALPKWVVDMSFEIRTSSESAGGGTGPREEVEQTPSRCIGSESLAESSAGSMVANSLDLELDHAPVCPSEEAAEDSAEPSLKQQGDDVLAQHWHVKVKRARAGMEPAAALAKTLKSLVTHLGNLCVVDCRSMSRPINFERLQHTRASMLELEMRMRLSGSDPTAHVAHPSRSDAPLAASMRQLWCAAHSEHAAALTSELATYLDAECAGDPNALAARLEALRCYVPELRAAVGRVERCSGDSKRRTECLRAEPQAGPALMMACFDAATKWETSIQASNYRNRCCKLSSVTDSAMCALQQSLVEHADLHQHPHHDRAHQQVKPLLEAAFEAVQWELELWQLILEDKSLQYQKDRLCESASRLCNELSHEQAVLGELLRMRMELAWLGNVPDEDSRATEAQPILTQLKHAKQAYNKHGNDSDTHSLEDSSHLCAWEEHESLVEAWCAAVELLRCYPDVMPSVQAALPPELRRQWNPAPVLHGKPHAQIRNLAAPGGHHMFVFSQDRTENGDKLLGVFKEFPVTVEGVAACVREARAFGQVQNHPNLLRLEQVFISREPEGRGESIYEPEQRIFLHMQPLCECSLETWVVEHKMDTRGLAKIVAQVLQAVAHLHLCGVVHGGIESNALLMDTKGVPRLAHVQVASHPLPPLHGRHLLVHGSHDDLDTNSTAWDILCLGQVVEKVASKCVGSNHPQLHALVEAMCHPDARCRPSAALAARHELFSSIWECSPVLKMPCTIGAYCDGEGDVSAGVLCGNTLGGGAHFTCALCLEAHVSAEGARELGARQQSGGQVRCPLATSSLLECNGPAFTHAQLARHLPEDAFRRHMEGSMELMEQRKVVELEQQLDVRLQTMLTQFTGMDEVSRAVLLARRHIEEEILNTRCPRCRAVFVDFDGCAALRCASCACGFCAWCLADCGRDAHPHLANCPSKPKSSSDAYFPKVQELVNAQRLRRESILMKYLAQLTSENLMDNTMVPEASRVVMRENDPELRPTFFVNKGADGDEPHGSGKVLFSQKWVKILYNVLATIIVVPDMRAVVKQYWSTMDGRAALTHVLTMMEIEYFGAKGPSIVRKRLFAQELVGKSDPAQLFMESDAAWHRYNRMVPHSKLAASTVSSAIIAALSENAHYENFLIMNPRIKYAGYEELKSLVQTYYWENVKRSNAPDRSRGHVLAADVVDDVLDVALVARGQQKQCLLYVDKVSYHGFRECPVFVGMIKRGLA